MFINDILSSWIFTILLIMYFVWMRKLLTLIFDIVIPNTGLYFLLSWYQYVIRISNLSLNVYAKLKSVLSWKMKVLAVFAIFLHLTSAFELFPENVWIYIEMLVKNKGLMNPHVIEPVYDRWQNGMLQPQVCNYLLPRVLLWDPLNQFPLLQRTPPVCTEHDNILVSGQWRCRKAMQPRWIYDKNGPIVLVMRNYICKSKEASHNFLSGECFLTDQLPPSIEIPFRLTHRAGFTTNLQWNVTQRYNQNCCFTLVIN